jgi:hypothetical protein
MDQWGTSEFHWLGQKQPGCLQHRKLRSVLVGFIAYLIEKYWIIQLHWIPAYIERFFLCSNLHWHDDVCTAASKYMCEGA